MKRLLAFGVPTAVLALAAAGCGSSDSTAGSDTTTPPRELTIEDALVGGAQGPVLVTGYAIPRDGELRLCSAILESYRRSVASRRSRCVETSVTTGSASGCRSSGTSRTAC